MSKTNKASKRGARRIRFTFGAVCVWALGRVAPLAADDLLVVKATDGDMVEVRGDGSKLTAWVAASDLRFATVEDAADIESTRRLGDLS